MMTGVSEQTLIAGIETRLLRQFPDIHPDVLDAAVREEHSRFQTSTIRDFVPLLVEKQVRQRLKVAAGASH